MKAVKKNEANKKKTLGIPSDKATRASMKSGRYITNGFADPLRSSAAGYKQNGGKVSCIARATITREAKKSFRPTRDKSTKELLFSDYPEFRPNLTPGEVINLGSFGGTYFRDIFSATAGKCFSGSKVYQELPWKEWG